MTRSAVDQARAPGGAPTEPGTRPTPPAACPICGSAQTALEYRVKGYEIARCAACCVGFTVLSAEQRAAVPDVYDEDYYEGKRDSNYENYFETQAGRVRQWTPIVESLFRDDEPRSILDVGCGGGFFLDTLGPRWRKEGTDIAQVGIEFARRRFPYRFHLGRLVELSLAPASYDVVTMWHVVEHFLDPVEELREVGRLLEPGGYCVIETCNYDAWSRRLAEERWRFFIPPFHLFFFSPRSLARLLERAGMTLVRTLPRGNPVNNWISVSRADPAPSRLAKKLLKAAGMALFRVTRQGDMMIYVARKRQG